MAHALKFHAVVSGKTLTLPDLSAFEGKRVEVIVMEEEDPTEQKAVPKGERRLGTLRGRFVVPDDFDAPLPPEIQSYFRMLVAQAQREGLTLMTADDAIRAYGGDLLWAT